MENLPDVYFGSPQDPAVNWREVDTLDVDDEELDETDPFVIAVLGFDPKDLNYEDDEKGDDVEKGDA